MFQTTNQIFENLESRLQSSKFLQWSRGHFPTEPARLAAAPRRRRRPQRSTDRGRRRRPPGQQALKWNDLKDLWIIHDIYIYGMEYMDLLSE